MRTINRGYRDWFIITVIILIGFLLLIIAGSEAMRFSARWQLPANMLSNLNPDSDFLTNRPQNFVEPIDLFILTPPAWIDLFQTPGATIPEEVSPTSTNIIPAFPTAAPARSATPNPTLVVTSYPITIGPNPTLTATVTPTFTQIPIPQNTATSTKPPSPPRADLVLTKDDGVLQYIAGTTLTYVVTIANNGPNGVTGAVIIDQIPVQVRDWSWVCTAQTGSASGCDPASTNAQDFSDTVNLPVGSSIQYTVTANIKLDASGQLENSALVAHASITDPNPGNNTGVDIDQFRPPSITPIGNIGPVKDDVVEVIPSGTPSIVLTLDPPIQVGYHTGYDLIYYEMANGSGIAMDMVILEIGDGTNWYTIFNWGDGIADTNSNLNINVIGGTEHDNRGFTTPPDSNILVSSTGITIELDGVVPNGAYSYIRLTCPASDSGDGCEVDGIAVVP